MNKQIATFFSLALLLSLPFCTQAQMERKRAGVSQTVDDAFWAPALITQATTEHLPAGNLNVTIMHSFGIATEDVVRNFFGLDNVQNVRLGLDFGITDRWSFGVGRSSLMNVVDLRTKYAVLRQSASGGSPLSVAVKGDLGVVTQENRLPVEDDVSTLVSAILSRKFSNHLSVQISPMYAHFNSVAAGEENDLLAVGIGAEWHLNRRLAVIGEYYPVIGDRNEGTEDAFSVGFNIETGGHVFQLFFASTQWHLEQYVLAQNTENFWAGDFRFGFNVNRIFGLW